MNYIIKQLKKHQLGGEPRKQIGSGFLFAIMSFAAILCFFVFSYQVQASTEITPDFDGPIITDFNLPATCNATWSIQYRRGVYNQGATTTPPTSTGSAVGTPNVELPIDLSVRLNSPPIYDFTGDWWIGIYCSFNDVPNDPDYYFNINAEELLYDSTRIISTLPLNNTILPNSATTTGIDVGATWYVTVDDLESLNTIFSDPSEKIRFTVSICPLDRFPSTSVCFNLIDYFLPTGYESSYQEHLDNFLNEGLFQDDLFLRENTDYRVTFGLVGSNYFGLLGNVFSVSTTTYFTIGSTTASVAPGGLSGEVASSTEANNEINPFAFISGVCNPFSTDFSVGDCLYGIVVPTPENLATDLILFEDRVTTMFPFGYVTDFLSIVRSTSTVPLVVLSATVPPGIPGQGAQISLDLTNVLDPFLNATTSRYVSGSATSTETLGTITLRYWNYLVYFFLILYILRRLFGSHIIPTSQHFGSQGSLSDTNSNDDSYRLKEWLYDHKNK